MIKNILFDFDGTIADTSEGIIKSMHYAFDKLGVDRVADATIQSIIGPPLEEMFHTLLQIENEKEMKQAVAYFRERYSMTGIREFCIYPEVKETLHRLQQEGYALYIVTSKPEVFVHSICMKEGLREYFTAITGVKPDGSSPSKSTRMKKLMETYAINPINGIMVGDRVEDASAASENNMQCVGMTYGFGKKEDLINAGCVAVLDKFSELVDYVGTDRSVYTKQ